MKKHPITAALLLIPCFVNAAIVTHVDSTEFTVGGTTQTFEANLATIGGAAANFSFNGVIGTDVSATISSTPTNSDWYMTYNSGALDINGAAGGTGLSVATYRYVEIFYNLEDAFTGTTQQLRLQTSANGAEFETFTNKDAIPGSVGDHSFIIDLHSDNANTWSGDWALLRWDLFNSANIEKTFTIDKVIYGSAISAVPEPATSALLVGFAILTLVASRRHRRRND